MTRTLAALALALIALSALTACGGSDILCEGADCTDNDAGTGNSNCKATLGGAASGTIACGTIAGVDANGSYNSSEDRWGIGLAGTDSNTGYGWNIAFTAPGKVTSGTFTATATNHLGASYSGGDSSHFWAAQVNATSTLGSGTVTITSSSQQAGTGNDLVYTLHGSADLNLAPTGGTAGNATMHIVF
ncbi:MAG: hypothetical protein JST92_07845 [Deltaproteobacteria bacterium]|nr:hypothetical protein [Deltaproteobacteria bacterium]